MGKVMRAIGLMSGTSMDGIDVGLLETDGDLTVKRGPSVSTPYTPQFRARLAQAVADAATLRGRHERQGCLAGVERELTELHAAAVLRFMGDHNLQPMAIDVIGFHGQTVLHDPNRRLTVQLGDGALLAGATRVDVVYDLRAADFAAGGQGAPLAPVYHRALVSRLPSRPIAFLNIGGVANVTWIGRAGELVAFDTGPGNGMIDDWMQRRCGLSCDEAGRHAASGRIHDAYVTQYLRHSYFSAPSPKSLDRNSFPCELVDGLSDEDGAATLTAFASEAIAMARAHFPEQPALWIVSGGGRKNRTLMSMIAARVENAVVPSEAIGVDGDSLEAEAWAYLAVRSLSGLPISYPGTTGVPQPMTGGVLARAP
ncbi:MAG TPA: anhydro-N-acetylmuramic acid kinase [Hyphomicrobiaceae bacterium]|nr:anhydro-N-acetylmuramic acid kinase [Hyphomicrobiaceae bacterium]